MSMLKSILREVIGLFIDDGMLALLCVALIAAVTVAILLLGLPGLWGATLLLIGCIAILAWSVTRAAK
jgi:hypothetical protein